MSEIKEATEQNKQLLLKDLCARLPYRLLGKDCFGKTRQMVVIYDTGTILAHEIDGVCCSACGFVPYLRPMRSMTDGEKSELLSRLCGKGSEYFHVAEDGIYSNDDDVQEFGRGWSIHWINFSNRNVDDYTEWLNRHHFDYRDLIGKGLALEAPDGMYNI